jgi:hypothetical protein
VSLDAKPDRIEFRLRGDPVTTYHFEPAAAKPYLWPLNAPGGVPVTRAWPLDKAGAVTDDHPHHVSAWFCHGDVIPEGVNFTRKGKGVDGVDFWAVGSGHGVIAYVEAGRPEGNHVRTRNEWRIPNGPVVLAETRTLSLHDVAGGRLIVMTTDLTPAGGPVVFGDTKEGAFGIRVSDQLRVGDKKGKNAKSKITNAAGRDGEKACWGYPSDWCDYSGEVDGKAVGVAVFDDPANRPRACWHVRDYGLLAANPFGREKSGFPAMRGRHDLVRLDKGEHLKLRYAIFLHAGDAAGGKVAEAFEQFTKTRD